MLSRIASARCAVSLSLVFGIALIAVPFAQADSPSITIIEEDWEVVIGTPDTNSTSPQIRSVMAPTSDLDGTYAAFALNHHTQPEFSPGGMQLQIWHGEDVQASHGNPKTERLTHTGETVRWTQRMTLANGTLTFEILNGTSTTWGTFGGEGYLKLSVASQLSDLNGYQSSVSQANSEVGFAANRVDSFDLTAIRAYTTGGLVWSSEDAD